MLLKSVHLTFRANVKDLPRFLFSQMLALHWNNVFKKQF